MMSNPMPSLAPPEREVRSRQDLEAAFKVFNSLSVRLEEAYGDLENQVASLDQELRVARREREIQRAEKERIAARMAGLMEELPVGVVLVGASGTVEEANPAARDMLKGLDKGAHWETVVGRNLVGSDSDGDMVLERRRRITLTRRELGGGPCVVVLTDVTQIHDLQERVVRNERLSEMGEMAARLAHQIRTPVATAMLHASALVSGSDEKAKRAGEKILARLRELEVMVNDMLMFARGDVGELARVSASEILSQVQQTLDPRMLHALSINSDAAPDSQCVFVNRDLLIGALVNLVSNGIQCGADHVELTARCSSEGFLELSVADDGPGVHEDIAAQIFEPFFTTRAGGTGLGLAVVRTVAESFGGSIQLERNARGGATFRLRLPLDTGIEYQSLFAVEGRLRA
jgi:two-component system sensor histidine kinase FlrB